MAPPTASLALRRNHAPDETAHQSFERSIPRLGGPLAERTIEARQQQEAIASIIPSYYHIDGPAPGTVVGIVLGSVTGFILIAWLLFSLTQGNTGRNGTSGHIAGEEEFVVRRPRRKSNSHAGRSRRSEVREYSRSPRQSGGGRSTVIVEERRPPPRARSRSIVVESRRPGDDIVEVFEEHDDYRSRRSGRRSPDYR